MKQQYCAGVAVAACAIAVALTGCSQKTITSAENDTRLNLAAAQTATDKLQQKIDPAAKKLGLQVRVTAALVANTNLPRTIHVDASTNSVQLKGTVNTAAQKALAGQVAKQTVPAGDSVANDLAVKPA